MKRIKILAAIVMLIEFIGIGLLIASIVRLDKHGVDWMLPVAFAFVTVGNIINIFIFRMRKKMQ